VKIDFFKKEKSFKKKDFTFRPNLFWRIVLLGAVILILLSSVFGYCLFRQINQESVLPSANGDRQSPIIDKEHIEKVLNYFSEREKNSNQILNSSSPVVDPSL